MENHTELLEEALLALDFKEINKAIDLFEKVLKLNPINSYANFGLGECYHELKDYKIAITYFEKVIETNNDNCADSYAMLGICNMFLAEKSTTDEIKYELKAIGYYSKVIDFYPKNIDKRILIDLALAYGYIKDYDNAILTNKKIIEIDDENADAYFHLAWLYNSQGNSNKALQYALKAIEIFDQSWNYYFHLSLIYSNLSNFEESINALKKAIEFATKAVDINPEDIYSICTLAEAYEHLNELNIAKNFYEKVLKLDSTFEDAIEGLKRVEEKE